jgi:hypothetical protein
MDWNILTTCTFDHQDLTIDYVSFRYNKHCRKSCFEYVPTAIDQETFEDTVNQSKQNKKDKWTNNDLQNITHKTKK